MACTAADGVVQVYIRCPISSEDEPDDLIGPVPLPAGVTVTSDLARKRAEVESRSVAMREKLVNKVREGGR